jgi:hypothetical protein
MGAGDTAYMGYSSYVGAGMETSYGVHATASAFCEFYSEGFKREIDSKLVESINTTRNYRRRYHGNENISGSVELPLNLASDVVCYILYQSMGGTLTSTQVGATTAYGHAVNEGDMESNAHTTTAKDIKGLSFSVRRGSQNTHRWQYNGCRVNSLSIKGDIGSECRLSAEFIGKSSTLTAAGETLTAAFTAITPVNFAGITIEMGDTTTTLSTTTYTGVEFTLGNNLVSDEKARKLGSNTLALCPVGMRDVKLKLTQRFDTTTSYVDYVANTQKAFKITFDSGVTIGAAASGNYRLEITIPKMYYGPNQPNVGDSGVITHELEMQGVADTITSECVSMTFYNATTSYKQT